ncbi:Phosphoenolpyruvate carboxylase [bacterium HR39]|nr:Phosphoenolpyruvate carboxylase [bacterium HR39]
MDRPETVAAEAAEAAVREAPGGAGADLRALLQQELEAERARAHEDPFLDPVGLLGVRLFRRLARRELGTEEVARLVRELGAEAFEARAARLSRYLGESDPAANRARIRELLRGLLAPDGNPLAPEEAARALHRIDFGFVFTAHPTFALARGLQGDLLTLALRRDEEGRPLDGEARAALLARIRARAHGPDSPLDLDYEQRCALEAAENLLAALRLLWEETLELCRELYPQHWRRLVPRLVSIASWVGYDTDGRADIPWTETFVRRLVVAVVQLRRYREAVREIRAGLAAGDPRADALDSLDVRLSFTIHAHEEACGVFREVAAGLKEGDPRALARLAAVSRMLADARPSNLHDKRQLLAVLDRLLAVDAEDGAARRLWLLRAEVATLGLGAARTHLRINARQVHNAVRHLVGLDHHPDDPSYRLTYLETIHRLCREVEPVSVNFGSLAHESATARRAFMLCAQMLKYVDGGEPIRFLIAECDSPFTILAALYLARLFGVDADIDISPLFETRTALERGAAIVDEALRYGAYRDYLRRRERICVQTGFSDAGRYLGQIAAADAIERIRLELPAVLRRHGLADLELVIFDTHGESMGRGAHPASLHDRLAYFDTPHSRRLFAACGIRQRQETSFQGGDGYLPFLRREGALAVLTRVLEHRLQPPPADEDPFYARPPYVDEFFAAVRQFNARLFEDPDYGAFLGAFGTNMLHPTGSRSAVREAEGGRPPRLGHPAQLRAIPHNAILQQLGYLVHVIGGVGPAIARDPEAFEQLYRGSDRFRRLVSLVEHAFMYSDPLVTKAYVDLFDPGGWLLLARSRRDPAFEERLAEVARHYGELALFEPLARVMRFILRDHLDLARALRDHRRRTRDLGEEPIVVDPKTRDNLHLLHVVRLALIRTLALLASEIPDFSDRHEVTRTGLVHDLLRLSVEPTLRLLSRIFRVEEAASDGLDYGEPASYAPTMAQSYAREHQAIFRPIAGLYGLIREITTAVVHHVGAVG